MFLLNLCRAGGDIVCIDHFDPMSTTAGRERYVKVTHSFSLAGKPFRIVDEFRITLLEGEMSAITPGFDWIYIDRSHEADHTFLDGELAWHLAREGSIP
jgi:hypothetical protein